ncbi:MAG: hypothetical protein ACD_78C00461G0003 [uncultured bacterium (gcode 4)]|uniref:Uncharacterized protein n=1 Tax=uncultured bacterium (gcode 4) TaxID=1234023 RepID=K1XVL7_9BACT|nr:MAG: hypothetical protein ACD_78C00461G0003 [uncultured bacterium (gcode 4)]
MPLRYTEKNDPSGFLAIHRQDINMVLSQAPSLKAKKKLVHILKGTIDRMIDIDWELQDLEYELFREQYEAWDPSIPNWLNNTYPEWYLFFRDNIISRIFAVISVDNMADEAIAKDMCLLDKHNERQRKDEELNRFEEELRMIDEIK